MSTKNQLSKLFSFFNVSSNRIRICFVIETILCFDDNDANFLKLAFHFPGEA